MVSAASNRIAEIFLCSLKQEWSTKPKASTARKSYMGVSKNNGTPKSSILIGFSIINHPFWGTPIFGNTHIYLLPRNCWNLKITHVKRKLHLPTIDFHVPCSFSKVYIYHKSTEISGTCTSPMDPIKKDLMFQPTGTKKKSKSKTFCTKKGRSANG